MVRGLKHLLGFGVWKVGPYRLQTRSGFRIAQLWERLLSTALLARGPTLVFAVPGLLLLNELLGRFNRCVELRERMAETGNKGGGRKPPVLNAPMVGRAGPMNARFEDVRVLYGTASSVAGRNCCAL